MRRNYISPEYQNNIVYGTFNMVEESNFFGAKMLDIEDIINISNEEIIYYQNLNGEQIDFSIESTLQANIYSTITDNQINHTLQLDETQSSFQKNKNTRWILTIEMEKIIKNYIFASLKKFRTFEGLRKDMTIYDDVNVAIKNYIDLNIYDRYRLDTIDLYISYNSLRSQNVLRFKNTWNKNAISADNKLTKIQTEYSLDKSVIKLIFNQDKPSTEFNFDYFFDLNLIKL